MEVEFAHKPGDVSRRPTWVAPHQPRLGEKENKMMNVLEKKDGKYAGNMAEAACAENVLKPKLLNPEP